MLAGYSLGGLLKIIAFTFEESLASTLLSLVVGITAAFFVSKRNFWGRKLLLSTASIPLCIPSLIILFGFVSTFGMSGYANRILMKLFSLSEPPLTFLYSFWGIVIAQGFYNFPLVMATVSDTWSTIPPAQADSARLLGATEFRVFRTITLHQLLPSIISACIPVFLYCFFSFMIVMLFGALGCTTLEVAVYHSARSTLNFQNAIILASIETICALGMVGAYGLIEKKSARSRGVSFCSDNNIRSPIKTKEIFFAFIFFVILLLFFIAPLASILVSSFTTKGPSNLSWTLHIWKNLFHMPGFMKALGSTLYTSLFVSLICTVSSFIYALFLRLYDPMGTKTILKTIPILPMAMSSVVLGLLMTLLVKRGTPFILIIAQSIVAWPFAFRQLYAPLAKIPQSVIDEARILSPHSFDAVWRVYIPYCSRGMLSAIGFCFAISAGDATIPLVLAIPRFDTLALFTYRLAGSHKFSEASAAGLILGLICGTVFFVSNKYKEKP